MLIRFRVKVTGLFGCIDSLEVNGQSFDPGASGRPKCPQCFSLHPQILYIAPPKEQDSDDDHDEFFGIPLTGKSKKKYSESVASFINVHSTSETQNVLEMEKHDRFIAQLSSRFFNCLYLSTELTQKGVENLLLEFDIYFNRREVRQGSLFVLSFSNQALNLGEPTAHLWVYMVASQLLFNTNRAAKWADSEVDALLSPSYRGQTKS
ncbi:unnamed protein product [Protopolystoma xenopodis]|uniref:Uncharacterized protein n=1 Tax=Protopolystoma xenopodis TaxID=117903 RepID=A0A3S5A182_9PLAT|nr:unnamed protein product [Protopolystoma xenopodis]